MVTSGLNRRPLKSRSTAWAQRSAGVLVRAKVSPDLISAASLAFAAIGSLILFRYPTGVALVAVALCVQLRLVCNLLDGMVAIEGGRKSLVGGLFNEIPDRLADSMFLVALGEAVALPALGWFAALAAALTAYIRVLGGTLGFPQDFRGPMAKPQRMAALTLACLGGAIEGQFAASHWCLWAAAWIIGIGSAVTCVTRTIAIARALRARG